MFSGEFIMKKNQNRNGMIDLMRFILSIILVIFHGGVGIYTLFNKQIIYFYGGPTAVEFFFLISGYLMAKSINEIRDNNNILKSSYNFFKKKILSFYPAYFICWLVSFILINILRRPTMKSQ